METGLRNYRCEEGGKARLRPVGEKSVERQNVRQDTWGIQWTTDQLMSLGDQN